MQAARSVKASRMVPCVFASSAVRDEYAKTTKVTAVSMSTFAPIMPRSFRSSHLQVHVWLHSQFILN